MVGLLYVGGLVCCVAFAGNGDVMMSGSEDERIRIWDVRSQLCKMVLRSERPYEGMRIGGVTGISEAQRATLMALGAIDAI
jgi:WD40 repeat protein